MAAKPRHLQAAMGRSCRSMVSKPCHVVVSRMGSEMGPGPDRIYFRWMLDVSQESVYMRQNKAF